MRMGQGGGRGRGRGGQQQRGRPQRPAYTPQEGSLIAPQAQAQPMSGEQTRSLARDARVEVERERTREREREQRARKSKRETR